MADRRSRTHDSPRRRTRDRERESTRSVRDDELPRSVRGAPHKPVELSSSYSSTSSSSYIDISRKSQLKRPSGLGAIRTFFTTPSERRRVRRRKSRRFLRFGNSSSSSVNTDLAYGTGYIKRRKGEKIPGKGKEKAHGDVRDPRPDGRDYHAEYRAGARDPRVDERGYRSAGREPRSGVNDEAAILAVGAGLAALAKKQNRLDLAEGRRSGSIPVLRQDSTQMTGFETSRGLGSSRISHGPDEDGWESTSDADSETSSVDSRLAYGHGNSKGWGFGFKRPVRKDSIVDPALFGPINSLNGVVQKPVGFNDNMVDHDDLSDYFPPTIAELQREEGVVSQSASATGPLQYVYPVPTSDPTQFDVARSSGAEPYISRPAPVPLQQPQPITPVSQSVYEPSLTTRSEPKIYTGRANSLAGAALAGVAGVAIGAAISDRRDERKNGEKQREDPRDSYDRSRETDRRRDEPRVRRDDKSDVTDDRGEKRRERHRDDPADEDRERRRERRREREREESRIELEKSGRERRREEGRDRPDETRSEKRREKRREDDCSDDRREKRRDDKYNERTSGRYEDRAIDKADVNVPPVDPFQYQVADDAFKTPDGTRNVESFTGIQRARSPAVVTVERVPHFARERSSSVKDKPAEPINDRRNEKDHDREYEKSRGKDRDNRERRRTEKEAESAYAQVEQFTAPIEIAAVGAAIAAVTAEDERKSRSEKGKRRRKVESDKGDKDPIQEEADRIYREAILARKIASENNDDPVPRVVTPPEMAHKKKESLYDAPNADFQLDHVMDPEEFQTSPIKRVGTFPLDYSSERGAIASLNNPDDLKRPLLTLVRPTPTPSPAPEQEKTRSERKEPSRKDSSRRKSSRDESPREQSSQKESSRSGEPTNPTTKEVVEDVPTMSRGDSAQTPTSTVSAKGVTWGENETKHYEIESPHETKDDPMERSAPLSEAQERSKASAARKASAWGALKGAFMSGAAAEIVAKAAEASEASKPKKSSKPDEVRRVDDKPFEYRGVVVEPELPGHEVRERGPPPVGPKPSKAPSSQMPGAFEDDLDFTATLAAGLEDSGFDPNIVIKDPTYRRRSSPPGSNDPPLAGYRQPYSETVSDLGSYADAPLGQKSRDIQDGRREPSPPQLTEKEQRKLERAAKRQSREVEQPSRETSVVGSIVEEPESYTELSRSSSKKDKKRDKSEKSEKAEKIEKSKRSKKDFYDETDDRGEKRSSKVSVPIDAFDDLRSEAASTEAPDDEWATPKKSKKSKRDSDQFEPPSRSMSASDMASSMEQSSNKKSKDKSSKRSSRQYDSEPNPEEIPLPTGSVVSRDDYDDEPRKSKKSSKRSSSISDIIDRDSRDRDTRSVKSSKSDVGDDEDSKANKKKNGGFFGLFGSSTSKSEPERERLKDKDEYSEPKKKNKKSKRSSTADSSEIYGSEVAASSAANGFGNYDDDDGDLKGSTNGDSKIGKVEEQENSFLGNAGTLGAGVGLAAAVAIAAQHQQSKAAHADIEERSSKKSKKSKGSRRSERSVSDDISGPREVTEPTLQYSRELSRDTSCELTPDVFVDASRDVTSKSQMNVPLSLLEDGPTGPIIDASFQPTSDVLLEPTGDVAFESSRDVTDKSTTHISVEPTWKTFEEDIVDPEISQRQSRPSIDPQYGDLLLLPPSDPGSPNIEPTAELPVLPESRPGTPPMIEDYPLREKSSALTRKIDSPALVKTPSNSAIPIKFKMGNRSTPSSPGVGRSTAMTSPTPKSPEGLGFAKSSRPRPTSWDSTKGIQPLYLLDPSRRGATGYSTDPEKQSQVVDDQSTDSEKQSQSAKSSARLVQFKDKIEAPKSPEPTRASDLHDFGETLFLNSPKLLPQDTQIHAESSTELASPSNLPKLPETREMPPLEGEAQVPDPPSPPHLPHGGTAAPTERIDLSSLPPLPPSRASTPGTIADPLRMVSQPEITIPKPVEVHTSDGSGSAAAAALAGTAFGLGAGALATSLSHHGGEEGKEQETEVLSKTLPAEELPAEFHIEPITKDRSSYLFQATPPAKRYDETIKETSPEIRKRELERLPPTLENASMGDTLGDDDSPTRAISRGREATLEALTKSQPVEEAFLTSRAAGQHYSVSQPDAEDEFFTKSKRDKKRGAQLDAEIEPFLNTTTPTSMEDTAKQVVEDEPFFTGNAKKSKKKDKKRGRVNNLVGEEPSSGTSFEPATAEIVPEVALAEEPSLSAILEPAATEPLREVEQAQETSAALDDTASQASVVPTVVETAREAESIDIPSDNLIDPAQAPAIETPSEEAVVEPRETLKKSKKDKKKDKKKSPVWDDAEEQPSRSNPLLILSVRESSGKVDIADNVPNDVFTPAPTNIVEARPEDFVEEQEYPLKKSKKDKGKDKKKAAVWEDTQEYSLPSNPLVLPVEEASRDIGIADPLNESLISSIPATVVEAPSQLVIEEQEYTIKKSKKDKKKDKKKGFDLQDAEDQLSPGTTILPVATILTEVADPSDELSSSTSKKDKKKDKKNRKSLTRSSTVEDSAFTEPIESVESAEITEPSKSEQTPLFMPRAQSEASIDASEIITRKVDDAEDRQRSAEVIGKFSPPNASKDKKEKVEREPHSRSLALKDAAFSEPSDPVETADNDPLKSAETPLPISETISDAEVAPESKVQGSSRDIPESQEDNQPSAEPPEASYTVKGSKKSKRKNRKSSQVWEHDEPESSETVATELVKSTEPADDGTSELEQTTFPASRALSDAELMQELEDTESKSREVSQDKDDGQPSIQPSAGSFIVKGPKKSKKKGRKSVHSWEIEESMTPGPPVTGSVAPQLTVVTEPSKSLDLAEDFSKAKQMLSPAEAESSILESKIQYVPEESPQSVEPLAESFTAKESTKGEKSAKSLQDWELGDSLTTEPPASGLIIAERIESVAPTVDEDLFKAMKIPLPASSDFSEAEVGTSEEIDAGTLEYQESGQPAEQAKASFMIKGSKKSKKGKGRKSIQEWDMEETSTSETASHAPVFTEVISDEPATSETFPDEAAEDVPESRDPHISDTEFNKREIVIEPSGGFLPVKVSKKGKKKKDNSLQAWEAEEPPSVSEPNAKDVSPEEVVKKDLVEENMLSEPLVHEPSVKDEPVTEQSENKGFSITARDSQRQPDEPAGESYTIKGSKKSKKKKGKSSNTWDEDEQSAPGSTTDVIFEPTTAAPSEREDLSGFSTPTSKAKGRKKQKQKSVAWDTGDLVVDLPGQAADAVEDPDSQGPTKPIEELLDKADHSEMLQDEHEKPCDVSQSKGIENDTNQIQNLELLDQAIHEPSSHTSKLENFGAVIETSGTSSTPTGSDVFASAQTEFPSTEYFPSATSLHSPRSPQNVTDFNAESGYFPSTGSILPAAPGVAATTGSATPDTKRKSGLFSKVTSIFSSQDKSKAIEPELAQILDADNLKTKKSIADPVTDSRELPVEDLPALPLSPPVVFSIPEPIVKAKGETNSEVDSHSISSLLTLVANPLALTEELDPEQELLRKDVKHNSQYLPRPLDEFSERPQPAADHTAVQPVAEAAEKADILEPDSRIVEIQPAQGSVPTGYSEEQLEAASQMNTDFGSSKKKSAKTKKGQVDLSRPSTQDDGFPSDSQYELSSRDLPVQEVEQTEEPDVSTPDGLAAGYRDDQISVAKQLQAEFGTGAKKSKKGKKGRANLSGTSTQEEFIEPQDELKGQDLPKDSAEFNRDAPDSKTPDGMIAGYKEDQLSLAKQLQAEFEAGAKKSKKGKKSRSTSRTPKGDYEPSSSYFEEPQTVEGQRIPETSRAAVPKGADLQEPQKLDGYAAGYSPDQLELARQMREEFASGPKKSKKDKKRESPTRSATDDNAPGTIIDGPPENASLATTEIDSANDSPYPLSTVPTPDDFEASSFSTKKGKKSKKRQTLLRSSTHDSEASAEPTRESSRDPGTRQQETENKGIFPPPDESFDPIASFDILEEPPFKVADEPEFSPFTAKKGKKGKKRQSILQSSSQEAESSTDHTRESSKGTEMRQPEITEKDIILVTGTPSDPMDNLVEQPSSTVQDEPETFSFTTKKGKGGKKRQSLLRSSTHEGKAPSDQTFELADQAATDVGIAALEAELNITSKKSKKDKKGKKARENVEILSPQDTVEDQAKQAIVDENDLQAENPVEVGSLADRIWGRAMPTESVPPESENLPSTESEDPLGLFPDKSKNKKKGQVKSIVEQDIEQLPVDLGRTESAIPTEQSSKDAPVSLADEVAEGETTIPKEDVLDKYEDDTLPVEPPTFKPIETDQTVVSRSMVTHKDQLNISHRLPMSEVKYSEEPTTAREVSSTAVFTDPPSAELINGSEPVHDAEYILPDHHDYSAREPVQQEVLLPQHTLTEEDTVQDLVHEPHVEKCIVERPETSASPARSINIDEGEKTSTLDQTHQAIQDEPMSDPPTVAREIGSLDDRDIRETEKPIKEERGDGLAGPTATVVGAAVAALAAVGVAKLSKESEKAGVDSTPEEGVKFSSSIERKLSKGKKGKGKAKIIDRRSSRQEDIFDDPVLWEGAETQKFNGGKEDEDANDQGDFWSVPPEEIEKSKEIVNDAAAANEPLGEVAHKRERSASLMDVWEPSTALDNVKTRRKHDYEDIPAAIARDANLEQEKFHEEPTTIEDLETELKIDDVPEDFLTKSSKKSKKDKKQSRMAAWDAMTELEDTKNFDMSSSTKVEESTPQTFATAEVRGASRSTAEPIPEVHIEDKDEVHEPILAISDPIPATSLGRSIEQSDLNEHPPEHEPKGRGDNAKARRRVQEMYLPPPTTLPPVIEEDSSSQPGLDREFPGADPIKRDRSIEDINRDSALVTGSPIPLQRNLTGDHEYSRDSGVHLGDGPTSRDQPPADSTDDALARLSWPTVDEETETVDLKQSQRPNIGRSPRTSIAELTAMGAGAAELTRKATPTPVKDRFEQAERSMSPNVGRLQTPDPKNRPGSVNSNRSSNLSSGTPPLRRSDRKLSGDLRSLSQRSQANLAKEAKEAAAKEVEAERSPATSIVSNANPIANEGRPRVKDMADVYDGFGEGRIGSPMSPTRPHSMRRRQSMQVLDLEARVEQLATENRMLAEAKEQAEYSLQASQRATLALADRDAEVDSLKQTLQWLQQEVERLKEVNDGLSSANLTLGRQHDERYGSLEGQYTQAARELEEMRHEHGSLGAKTEVIIREQVEAATLIKDREIARLLEDLEHAQAKIRELQRQILDSKASDGEFLVLRDEDYFDNACQQLCQHVQQWVLRFSKFSDMRACRLTSEINNDKTIDRLDNAVLDGSDVDDYLSDRVKRRDIFMSMTMTMIWEFVFTRYLFGMDREQRQKLKSLEKTLMEVGPPAAVHQWRATTLTLLSKRHAFHLQREQDTEAVVQMIFQTLSEILPPPTHLEEQIQDQLKRVLKAAVDLSIEMRTQRAEYMMLPPLQPEYDANGELARQVQFNAALMNERSGDTVSNEDLEAQKAVVRVVLFPLVVKKGDDQGSGDDEIVVCPAQVLVAKPTGRHSRVFSPSGMGEVSNASRMSMQSTIPTGVMAVENPPDI